MLNLFNSLFNLARQIFAEPWFYDFLLIFFVGVILFLLVFVLKGCKR